MGLIRVKVKMNNQNKVGWAKLVQGHPWFSGKGRFPIRAYSEFMPPPRLGKRPYTEMDVSLVADDDPFGWYITEVEEAHELRGGLEDLVRQIEGQVVELGQGRPAHHISGHQGRNLINNTYWPPELAARAGQLFHERYVILLSAAFSRTQDDKGRVRWTFFGSSEQGPEKAFWKSFYSAPDQELPVSESLSSLLQLLSEAYGERCGSPDDLFKIGFRILPTEIDSRFPYWHEPVLPAWTRNLTLNPDAVSTDVRYLLTFQPFGRLPEVVRQRYLAGQLALLPFPGSLVFWGVPNYIKLQKELPMAMQLPLQRVAARHGGPEGIKVPQSGWFYESGKDFKALEVQDKLLLNSYKRTSRWDRVRRYEDEVVLSTIEDTIGRTLFGTQLDVMGLYGKPMARNSQLWTADSHLILDGPWADRQHLEEAARIVAEGGAFRYRFQFPAMRVGLYEIYWQLPLIAYRSAPKDKIEYISSEPPGYFTAYSAGVTDLSHPIELWPRILKREAYLLALNNFEHLREHYSHQTALNIVRFLDTWRRFGEKPMSRSFARQVLRLPERETLEEWLESLPGKAANRDNGLKLQQILERCLEPLGDVGVTSLPGIPPLKNPRRALTYSHTAARAFEEAWWNDIRKLSGGEYINKDNADFVQDPVELADIKYHKRDLERMGEYLLGRYHQAVEEAGMQGRALYGELPFHWTTDFDFSVFGGWKDNQEGHTYERDLMLVIPGKNRRQAVIMADHYDTAYMEDMYAKSRGGKGFRIAAAGADDNYSATATLLQSAPIFLQFSREGRLERDIWLVHLTGEEFPSDCMGARHLAQSLIEKNLLLKLENGTVADLSDVQIVGVYVLDMIGHNRENDLDEFQISPGKGRTSLKLAREAHIANALWNMEASAWNQSPERKGKGRSQRSDGSQIPEIAKFIHLQGEVRLNEDPRSSLFNTDGQIFSDCGIPVVLFMENYDINRSGYHDMKDTLENIDLDYGSALAAIAIETVASTACRSDLLVP
jgi:Peptidase family M28